MFFATAGVRVDDHSRFGAAVTYRLAPVVAIDEIGARFKATYGTGFKAPTLFQLYSPSPFAMGNPNLNPERSQSFDIGVEQSLWKGRAALGATYFHTDFKDMINLLGTSYANVDRATAQGLELTAESRPLPDLTLGASYTFTKTEDLSTGLPLLRRAGNRFNMKADYAFLQKGHLRANLRVVGERDDMDFTAWPAARVTLDPYVVMDVAASWRFNEHLEVFGRIENLTNEKYQEVFGYGTPGIAAYAGVDMKF
jgi:vitamin B12 transporter